eukprot:Gb_27045 [translate_table: standard]
MGPSLEKYKFRPLSFRDVMLVFPTQCCIPLPIFPDSQHKGISILVKFATSKVLRRRRFTFSLTFELMFASSTDNDKLVSITSVDNDELVCAIFADSDEPLLRRCDGFPLQAKEKEGLGLGYVVDSLEKRMMFLLSHNFGTK